MDCALTMMNCALKTVDCALTMVDFAQVKEVAADLVAQYETKTDDFMLIK